MNDLGAQVSSISDCYRKRSDEALFKELLFKHKKQEASHSQDAKGLSAELTQLLRYNDQLESVSVHLRHSCKRLEDSLSSLTRMRLPQAKGLVRLEEETFSLEDEIQQKKHEVDEKEEILRSGLKPSVDSLFLELVKGFRIDFIDKDGMKALIKNHKKNDVVSIDIDNSMGDYEVADQIWSNI